MASKEKVKKEAKHELNLLISSFIALKHLHCLVKGAEGDVEKVSDKKAKSEVKHIWRKLRTGFFGSEERVERKVARCYEDLTSEIKSAELTFDEINKINNLMHENNIFNSLLEKLCSRGGEIENSLHDAMDEPKNQDKLKDAEKLIERAVKSVEGFEIDMKKIINEIKEDKCGIISFSLNLDKEKAFAEYNDFSSKSRNFIQIYRENYFGNIIFLVARNKKKITFDLTVGNVQKANLIFETDDSFLNLSHRIVNAKDFGISGTLFLKKAENYLKFLKKNGFLKETSICMDASQGYLIKWALKNSFTFLDKSKKEEYKTEILSGSKKYTRITVYDPGMIGGFYLKDYIILTTFFEKYGHLFKIKGDEKIVTKSKENSGVFAKALFRARLLKSI
jgi:hypothetical protein